MTFRAASSRGRRVLGAQDGRKICGQEPARARKRNEVR